MTEIKPLRLRLRPAVGDAKGWLTVELVGEDPAGRTVTLRARATIDTPDGELTMNETTCQVPDYLMAEPERVARWLLWQLRVDMEPLP